MADESKRPKASKNGNDLVRVTQVTFSDSTKAFAPFGSFQTGFDDPFCPRSADSPKQMRRTLSIRADRERQMSVAVADLVTCSSMIDINLTKRIQEADKDKSGTLSLKELFAVFKSELHERSRAAFFRRWVIMLSVVCLILVAANAGATAAIVILTKDTQANPTTGELLVKGSDTPVVTGMLHTPLDTTNFTTLTADPKALADLQRIGWVDGTGGPTTYSVCGTSVDPINETVTILTCAGVPLLFTNTGMQEDTSAAPGGRRRLLMDPVVSTSVTALSVATSLSGSSPKKAAAPAAPAGPKRIVRPTFGAVPDGLIAPGRVIVKRKRVVAPGGKSAALAAGATGLQAQELPAGQSVKDGVAKLKAQDDIEDAWPDQLLVPQHGALRSLLRTPNDPRFGDQWGLTKVGAPAAWDIVADWATRGISPQPVSVCVVDSGVDGGHADLQGRLGEGYNPWEPGAAPNDDSGHGTHIAGIITAAGDNGIQGTGLTWGEMVSVLSCKFIGPDGYGLTSKAIACLEWCTNKGAQVISASWTGGSKDNPPLETAIQAAGAAGALVVVAAGNQGMDLNAQASFPALYSRSMPHVITVGASDRSDALASFSNYDVSAVQLAAPGVEILSTVPGGVAFYSGTSMSTPFVSAAAAVLFSLTGKRLSPQQARDILVGTAAPAPGLAGKSSSGGVLRLDSALQRLLDAGLVSLAPQPQPSPAAANTDPFAGGAAATTTPSDPKVPKYKTVVTYVACKKGSSKACKQRCTVVTKQGKKVKQCKWQRAVVKKVRIARRLLALDLGGPMASLGV